MSRSSITSQNYHWRYWANVNQRQLEFYKSMEVRMSDNYFYCIKFNKLRSVFSRFILIFFCYRLVPPLKKQKLEEPTSDIPDVLQGEIARLDQRFKVSLDPNQQPGSKSIQLICWLDDKHLPCVPPVSLVVPEDYPRTSPTCHMAAHEYNATQFLSDVQTALLARIKKLPKHFSVSQLLDTWEMSVRQAAAPANSGNNNNNSNMNANINTQILLMGL